MLDIHHSPTLTFTNSMKNSLCEIMLEQQPTSKTFMMSAKTQKKSCLKELKIGSLLGSRSELNFMSELFKSRVENIEKDLNRIPNYDFIIFWGGEDISTGFYKERSVYSNSNEFRSKRDFLEETAFNYAKTTGKQPTTTYQSLYLKEPTNLS